MPCYCKFEGCISPKTGKPITATYKFEGEIQKYCKTHAEPGMISIFVKYSIDHKEQIKKQQSEYRIANWDKKKAINNKWRRENYGKMKADPNRAQELAEYKIKTNTSRRIREMLGVEKSEASMKYVGCSIPEFRTYLENQFEEGMSWNNYGSNDDKNVRVWHIDHRLPCDAFDMSNKFQVQACFHYTNLQPMWAVENIIKRNSHNKDELVHYLNKMKTIL